MKFPIPDDWGGENWQCIRVEWPDSPVFTAILTGLLSALSVGWFWDERSGSVRDAQEIGRDIWERNYPLISCSGGTIEIDDTATGNSIAIIERGMQIMSLCGYNPKAFKVENGNLYVRDFCGEWVEVGALYGPEGKTMEIPAPSVDAEDDATYSLCGKAQGYINTIKAVVTAAWEATFMAFLDQEGHVRNAADWATMGRQSIWLAIGSAIQSQAVSDEGTVLDDDRWARMVCQAVGQMSDSPVMSEEDRLACESSMRSVVMADFGAAQKESVWSLVKNSIDALGKGDGRNAGTVGAADLSAECDCPETYDFTEVDPFGFAIYTGAENFMPTAWNWSWEQVNPSTIIIDVDVPAGTYEQIDNITFTFAKVNGDIQELEVTTKLLQGPRFPASDWQQVAPIPSQYWAEYNDIDGSTITIYRAPGVSVAVHRWGGTYKDMDGKFAVFQNMRFSPYDNTPAGHYKFQMQITYSGPLRGV